MSLLITLYKGICLPLLPCCQRIPLGLEPHHTALDWALIPPKVRRTPSTGRHHLDSTVISRTAWVLTWTSLWLFSLSHMCVSVSSNVPVNLATLSQLDSFTAIISFLRSSRVIQKVLGFVLTKKHLAISETTLTTHTTHTSSRFWFRGGILGKRESWAPSCPPSHPVFDIVPTYRTSKVGLHFAGIHQ